MASTVSEVDRNKVIRQAAKYAAAGVADAQIAEAMGVMRSTVCQWRVTEVWAETYAKHVAEVTARATTLNGGWDELEEKAIAILQENLRINRNAEFALRVAAVSNRAQRKGAIGPSPLPADRGKVVAITFNNTFVEKIQQIASGARPPVEVVTQARLHGPAPGERPMKSVNMLNPTDTHALLTSGPMIDNPQNIVMEDINFTVEDLRVA